MDLWLRRLRFRNRWVVYLALSEDNLHVHGEQPELGSRTIEVPFIY